MRIGLSRLTAKNFVISQYQFLFLVELLNILQRVINRKKRGNKNIIMLQCDIKVYNFVLYQIL